MANMTFQVLSIVWISVIITANAAHLRSSTTKIYIGAALISKLLSTDSNYKAICGQELSSLTPENNMKWGSIERTKGQQNYTKADKLVQFAQLNNMKVRGHTLVWHNQVPNWIRELNKTELETALKQHITEQVTRYKGKIYAWDVVNEAFEDNGTYRDSIWHKNFGSNYISRALKTAHSADPNAKLYINDYNIESINNKSDALYKLVSELKSKAVPIHGVGFQCHFSTGHIPKDLTENLERFSALGLDVAITELDIKLKLPSNEEKFAQQAREYASVFKSCLSVSRCVGVTTWGFTDKYSWIPDFTPGFGDALLWDNNYKPKPAVTAIEEVLKSY